MQSEASLGNWKAAIQDALGENGYYVSNMVPEIELIIGKQRRRGFWVLRKRKAALS